MLILIGGNGMRRNVDVGDNGVVGGSGRRYTGGGRHWMVENDEGDGLMVAMKDGMWGLAVVSQYHEGQKRMD